MKKLSLYFAISLLCSMLLTSCGSEGPVGPQGEQGVPGLNGRDGSNGQTTGSAAIYSWNNPKYGIRPAFRINVAS